VINILFSIPGADSLQSGNVLIPFIQKNERLTGKISVRLYLYLKEEGTGELYISLIWIIFGSHILK